MQFQDFKITEQVRRILARHWVDTSKLDYGTTNSVVYIRGVIRQIKSHTDKTKEIEEKIQLVKTLETEIKRIPAVSGIVMKLDGLVKQGGSWHFKQK